MVALACSILGSGIGSDTNNLTRNISSEDVDSNFFFVCVCSVCCSEVFETKFELQNVTKRSYVNQQICEF